MAEANLNLTIQTYIAERARINNEIQDLQAQKTLSLYSQSDISRLEISEKNETREYWEALFDADPSLQEKYTDYTEIPDFDEEIEKITALYTEQLQELSAWESNIDTQITTDSATLTEIDAYLESYKSMMTTNIQNDYNYGLNS